MYNEMNSLEIILGLSLDPRIGNYYNNPLLVMGLLPKRQTITANFEAVPQNIITAIVKSNRTRINFSS